MDVHVEVKAHIPVPVDVVATIAGDPLRAPDWYANLRSVTCHTAPPLRVGSRMDFVATFLGRRLAYTYEVVELEPGARLVMRTSDGPFPMETTYTWQAVDGGTVMSLRNRGEPTGFSRIAAPVMTTAMKRAMTKDLHQLRQVCLGTA